MSSNADINRPSSRVYPIKKSNQPKINTNDIKCHLIDIDNGEYPGEVPTLSLILEKYPDFEAKFGDFIENLHYSGYRMDSVYMFDGEEVKDLYDEFDDYGTVIPEVRAIEHCVDNYPLRGCRNVVDWTGKGKKSWHYYHCGEVMILYLDPYFVLEHVIEFNEHNIIIETEDDHHHTIEITEDELNLYFQYDQGIPVVKDPDNGNWCEYHHWREEDFCICHNWSCPLCDKEYKHEHSGIKREGWN